VIARIVAVVACVLWLDARSGGSWLTGWAALGLGLCLVLYSLLKAFRRLRVPAEARSPFRRANVVTAALTLIVFALGLTQIPLVVRFTAARVALEEIALHAEQRGSPAGGWAGSFMIERVDGIRGGVLLVLHDDGGWLDRRGFVFVSPAVDSRASVDEVWVGATLVPLDGPWSFAVDRGGGD